MPTFSTIPSRAFNPKDEAANREQKRQAHLQNEERNKQLPVFMFQGFGFRPTYTVRGPLNMEGPLCPRLITKERTCFAGLTGESAETTSAVCEVCGGTFTLSYGFQRFREIAHRAYEGYINFIESGGQIITLDVPYEAIKARAEDETRAIEVKWSQKDGRNMAEILFIDRKSGKDKVQVFVDMDREELRHDASNTAPKNVLAEVHAVFRDTKVDIEYNP